MEMSSASTEWVHFPIPTAPADVTTGTVQIAFLALRLDPDNTTVWTNGSWVAAASPATARILVGPGAGGLVVAAGVWRPWLKIAGFSPELPVIAVPGSLRIV